MSVGLNYKDLLTVLALILLSAIGISVYIHNRRSAINRLFALFLLNVTLWLSLTIIYYLYRDLLYHLVIVQTIVGSFMGLTFYLFARAVADENFRLRIGERALVVIPFGLTIWYFITLMDTKLFSEFSAQVRYDGISLHRPANLPYIIYTTWLLGSFIAGYAVMLRGFRATPDPQAKRRIRHVLAASIIGQIISLILVNVSSILGLGQSGRLALVPIIGALFWVGFSIIRDRIWTVEYLLDTIRESEEKLAERNRIIENDLELARLVQRKLLPLGVPSVPGIEVYAVYQPVEKVGGDYYDFIVDNGSLGVIIVDVSGHGIASAFLSSIIKMGFHYHRNSDGPGLLAALDTLVADKGASAMFATAVFCKIDPIAKKLITCRAGHCPPLLMKRSRDEVIEIEPKGRALGMGIMGQVYQISETALARGDRLLLYTDGIVEAMDPRGELFGSARLVELFRRTASMTLQESCESILAEIDTFAQGAPRRDDITLIAVEIT